MGKDSASGKQTAAAPTATTPCISTWVGRWRSAPTAMRTLLQTKISLIPKGVIVAGKRQDNEYNAEKPEGQYWIYHNDVRGSVTNIIGTDASGALYRAESNAYDAFGKDDAENKEAVSSIQNDVKFTGAVQDNTGLYSLSRAPLRPEHGAVPPTGYSKWRPVQPVDTEPVHLYLQQPDKLYRPNRALVVPGGSWSDWRTL